jgi:hypothetical protein
MPGISSWLAVGAVVLALGGAAMSPDARASGSRSQDTGSEAPQALYTLAMRNLGLVGRLEFGDTVNILQPTPSTVRYTFRYAAPGSLAGALLSTPARGKAVSLESIQVGTIKCQRPPSWVCFHSQKIDMVGLVRSLITPQQGGLNFRGATTLAGPQGQRDRTVQLLATVHMQNVTYMATLTVDATTRLPLTFTSVVTASGQIVARQSVTFRYGSRFTIQLPQGKGVTYPKS